MIYFDYLEINVLSNLVSVKQISPEHDTVKSIRALNLFPSELRCWLKNNVRVPTTSRDPRKRRVRMTTNQNNHTSSSTRELRRSRTVWTRSLTRFRTGPSTRRVPSSCRQRRHRPVSVISSTLDLHHSPSTSKVVSKTHEGDERQVVKGLRVGTTEVQDVSTSSLTECT